MKVGDKVELAARVLCDPRASGKIVRVHSGSSRVSVMWQLDNGGVKARSRIRSYSFF